MLACRLHVTLFAFAVCCVLLLLLNDANVSAFQLQEYRRHHGHDEEPYELQFDSDSLTRVKRGSNRRRNGHSDHSHENDPVHSRANPEAPLIRSKRIKRQAVSTMENSAKPINVVAIPPEKSVVSSPHKEESAKPPPKETPFKEDSMLVKEDSRFVEPERNSKHRQEEVRKHSKSGGPNTGSNVGRDHKKMKTPKDKTERFEATEHHHHQIPYTDRERLDLIVKNAVKQAQREKIRNKNRPRNGGPKKVMVSEGYPEYKNGRLVLNNVTSEMYSTGTRNNDKGFRQRGNSRGGQKNLLRPQDGNGIPTLDHHHHHESNLMLSSTGEAVHHRGGGKKQSKQRKVKVAGSAGDIGKSERRVEHELHRMKRMQRDLINEISHLERLKSHRAAAKKVIKAEKKKKRAVY